MDVIPGSLRLLIVADTETGGLGAAAFAEAMWFNKRGWSVRLLSPQRPAARYEIDWSPWVLPGRAAEVFRMFAASRSARSIIRAFRPDIVHCHGLRSWAAIRAVKGRVFLTVHGFGPPSANVVARGTRRALLRIAPSLAPAAWTVLPTAYRGWRFLPHASPRLAELDGLILPSGQPRIMWVGRLAAPKLPLVLLDALPHITRTCGDIETIILGDGPMRADLAEEVESRGLNVRFEGFNPRPETFMRTDDIYVLFSQSEGVPFAAQEAMWLGLPGVVSDLPGLRWLGQEAFLFASEPKQAVGMICELLQNPAERRRRAGQAAERVRQLLGPDAPLEHVEDAFLREIASRKSNRGSDDLQPQSPA